MAIDFGEIFNLSNIGAVAKGLDAADTEITNNRFKIRNEELKAKRESLIKRKNMNYEIDLKAYAKEKDKADEIKSLNAEGDIGSYNYATRWLSITDKNFKNYDKTQQNSMISSLMTSMSKNKDADGKILAKNYVASGTSKEELELKYANQEAKINKIITDETLKAKEKSFLIEKILGIKEEETDVDAQIAAALKAEKKVEAEENSALTANVLSEDALPSHIDSDKFKKYKDKVASINEKNIWKTERDGVARFSFTSTLKANGFDTKNYVRFEDSKPVEFNISGDSYGNAYEKIYSTKHAENNTQDFSLKLYTQNDDLGTLASNPKLSNSELHKDTQRIISDRATENTVRSVESFSMVPLAMVNDNNKLVYDGKVYTLTNNQLLNGEAASAKTIYNKIVGDFVTNLVKDEGWAGEDEVHRAYSGVQNGLTDGHDKYVGLDNYIKEQIIKELKLVPDSDKKETTTTEGKTTTENKEPVDTLPKKDKKTKSHIVVKDGKITDTTTGESESLNSINDNGKIDLLPNHIKESKEFKEWASKNSIKENVAPTIGEEPEYIWKDVYVRGVKTRKKVKNPNYIDTSLPIVPKINKKRVR